MVEITPCSPQTPFPPHEQKRRPHNIHPLLQPQPLQISLANPSPTNTTPQYSHLITSKATTNPKQHTTSLFSTKHLRQWIPSTTPPLAARASSNATQTASCFRALRLLPTQHSPLSDTTPATSTGPRLPTPPVTSWTLLASTARSMRRAALVSALTRPPTTSTTTPPLAPIPDAPAARTVGTTTVPVAVMGTTTIPVAVTGTITVLEVVMGTATVPVAVTGTVTVPVAVI